jgi:hypothetical protein
MRLLLKGLDLLGVKAAGEALKDINGAIDGVGKFFDGAAKKVEGYKKTLDGLADKKITLPSFGAPPETPATTTGAEAPGGGTTADQLKAAKASAAERAKLLKKAYEDVQDSYDKMNKVIVEAQEKGKEITEDYNKKIVSIRADHAKQETKARKDHLEKQTAIYKDFAEKEASIREDNAKRELAIRKSISEKELAIRKDYADKVIQLQVDAENKRAGIIQKSKDLLISAFQNATKFDLASLMKDSDGSGETMIERMQEKFTKVLDLQRKAGELASKGFSQAFIQDVISQGPEAGNAMADSILLASPESVLQMQSLYGKIQDVSENGMNKLADQMYEQMGLATQGLRDQYEQVGTDLTAALLKAAEAFTESMTKNSADLTEELKNNSDDLVERLSENTKELNKALEENDKNLADTLADIQISLQEALFDAQEAYNEAIADLEKDTKAKLAELQAELLKTAAIIKELAGAKAAAAALAASPAAAILAEVKPILDTNAGSIYNAGMRPTMGGGYQGYNADMAYAMSAAGMAAAKAALANTGGVTVTQNITYPTASASDISAQTLSAIKFGTTSVGRTVAE